MWTLTPGFADTPLFCGHSEALRWGNLQFSIYLEIRGWRSCSCLLGDLKCRCCLPYSPNPCKHCFPKQRGLSLEDARDSCLASGSDFRWHSSSSPTHPLKPLPSLLFPQSVLAPALHLHPLVHRPCVSKCLGPIMDREASMMPRFTPSTFQVWPGT